MPDQSHFHGTPSGGDTPLVALTAASNRREWDLVYYLHIYSNPDTIKSTSYVVTSSELHKLVVESRAGGGWPLGLR